LHGLNRECRHLAHRLLNTPIGLADTIKNMTETPETIPDTIALAMVNGAPFTQIPDDLYIPPDALEVFLELFTGPLDLLLYLIRRQNVDIIAIPIAQITRQYMVYIQLMGDLKIELAADYLVMAAWLAEIKSRMLLPRPPDAEDEEEDPRATLIRRLQEYEAIKYAAEALEELPRMERDFFSVEVDTSMIDVVQALPDVQLSELLLAFKGILKRAEQLSHHAITKEALSVRERMSTILENLKGTDSRLFTELFSHREGRSGVVVAFLAILELGKEGLIEISQAEPFAELRVRATRAAFNAT